MDCPPLLLVSPKVKPAINCDESLHVWNPLLKLPLLPDHVGWLGSCQAKSSLGLLAHRIARIYTFPPILHIATSLTITFAVIPKKTNERPNPGRQIPVIISPSWRL